MAHPTNSKTSKIKHTKKLSCCSVKYYYASSSWRCLFAICNSIVGVRKLKTHFIPLYQNYSLVSVVIGFFLVMVSGSSLADRTTVTIRDDKGATTHAKIQCWLVKELPGQELHNYRIYRLVIPEKFSSIIGLVIRSEKKTVIFNGKLYQGIVASRPEANGCEFVIRADLARHSLINLDEVDVSLALPKDLQLKLPENNTR